MKKYEFEPVQGTVTIECNQNYRNDCFDVNVYVDEPWNEQEFVEVDQADEIFQWLVEIGVEWVTPQAFLVNYHVVQDVMLDRDAGLMETIRTYDSLPREEAMRRIRDYVLPNQPQPKFTEVR